MTAADDGESDARPERAHVDPADLDFWSFVRLANRTARTAIQNATEPAMWSRTNQAGTPVRYCA